MTLRVEELEDRTVPSAAPGEEFHPMVVGGSPTGFPTDSSDARIDPNTSSSPFAGVGAIQIDVRRGSFIGTGTLISPRHVLTAAHVLDLNNNGKVDRGDGLQGVYFILNAGGDQSARIAVTAFDLEPNFSGFNRPAVNDDLAVLTLAEDAPAGVPIYPLATTDLVAGTVLTMVGYGQSGDGVRGYTTAANPTVKRVGENVADAFYGQDDKGQADVNEVYRFDFDGPTGDGRLGGPTLGNDREMQLGAGDSGGPAFINDNGVLILAGVSSFTQGTAAPKFGSMGGGMNVFAYLSFIHSVISPSAGLPYGDGVGSTPPPSSEVGAGNRPGIRIGARPLRARFTNFPPPPPPLPPVPPVSESPPITASPVVVPPGEPGPVPPSIPEPLPDPIMEPIETDAVPSDPFLLETATAELGVS